MTIRNPDLATTIGRALAPEPARTLESGSPHLDKEEAPPGDSFARAVGAPDYSPLVAQPLSGAFVASPAPAGASSIAGTAKVWDGPVLGPDELEMATESRLLQGSGKGALLVPYGSFDAAKEPVVLVHGYGQGPETMRAMATRLAGEGLQVLVLLYDDRGQTIHDNGAFFASALAELRTGYYARGTPLAIVAHSAGGLVSRCALNTLQQPAWLEERSTTAADPRAGFGKVRLRTIDTPWEGFTGPPGVLYDIISYFMRLFHRAGMIDMAAQSAMYERLYRPKLEGVELVSTAVRKPGHDALRTLPEADLTELGQIVRYLEKGARPRDLRARNLAHALEQDARYPELVKALAAHRAEPARTPDGGAQALIDAYLETMPVLAGGHTEILLDTPSREDLVDRMVRDLSTR